MEDQTPPHANVAINMVLRPVRDEDEPFLIALRNEADAERLLFDYVDLTIEEKALILDQQAKARAKHFEDADWEKTHCLVECNETPIGTFFSFQDREEIRLADILVSSQFRGMGIGQMVIQAIQQECIQSKRPLRLHVEKNNPAKTFYKNLGFELLEDRESHFFLEWVPPGMHGKTLYFPGK